MNFQGSILDPDTMVLTSDAGEMLNLKRVPCQDVTPNVCEPVFDIHRDADGLTSAWGGAVGSDQLFLFVPSRSGPVSGADFSGSELLAGVESPLAGSFSREQILFTVDRAGVDPNFRGTIADENTMVLISSSETLILKRERCPQTACPVTLTISPPSQSLAAGGSGVTFTAALTGSSATINWSLEGPGSIAPTTGNRTDYAPPSSVAALTTATLIATVGEARAVATITLAPPPTLTAVDPGTGPTAGGTRVTLTGTDFAPAATVSFGDIAGSGVNVVSATSIVVTTPAHGAGKEEPIAFRRSNPG